MFCCSPERKGTDKTMKKMLSMTLSKVYASHSNTGLHSFPATKRQDWSVPPYYAWRKHRNWMQMQQHICQDSFRRKGNKYLESLMDS
uniref:Uncharacterized protein MANES_14G086600 n=1 Tax=Rhizophora mucronata TaxID=61149 RepID=A0A2P2JCA3_RHIMU